jgi:hypothetical protein
VPNSADNEQVKELYDDDSDSGQSEHTIEVRSSFGSDPEDRPKHYGDDISIDPEFQPDIELRSKMELSWRREMNKPQMDPMSMESEESPLFSMEEKRFKIKSI